MCSDDNIYQPLFRILDCLLLLRRRTESAHQIDPHRKVFHTLHERPVMLLCKDCCRNQIDHLFTLLYCFECRTDRNFCFSESDIATDQTVHDLVAFHIFFHSLDRHHLVFCLFKREHLFEFPLPDSIFSIDITILFLSRRIQLHQIPCNLFYRTAHLCLGPVPFLRSQLVQFRFLGIGTCIFLDQIQLRCRDIKISALCIRNFHIILRNLVYDDLLDPLIDPDTMILMDHIVSRFQFRKALDLTAFICLSLFLLFPFAENVRLCDHSEFEHRIFITFCDISVCRHDLSRLHFPVQIFTVITAQIIIS